MDLKLFRVCTSESLAWNYTKTLIQTAIMWISLLLIGPTVIIYIEIKAGVHIGYAYPIINQGWLIISRASFAIFLFISASTLGITCSWYMASQGKGTPLPMDTARELVIAGPYKYLRNPMATAGITQGIAVGIGMGSWGVILYALCGAAFWHIAIRPIEERDLSMRFRDAYEQYRSKTPLWLPRFAF